MTTSTTTHIVSDMGWRDPAVARRGGGSIDAALQHMSVDSFLSLQDELARGAPIPAALPFATGLVAVLRRASALAAADGEFRVGPVHLGRALRGETAPDGDHLVTLDATATVAHFLDEATDRAYAEGAAEVRLGHLIAAVQAEVAVRRQVARAA
jgi:hypothetical protein